MAPKLDRKRFGPWAPAFLPASVIRPMLARMFSQAPGVTGAIKGRSAAAASR